MKSHPIKIKSSPFQEYKKSMHPIGIQSCQRCGSRCVHNSFGLGKGTADGIEMAQWRRICTGWGTPYLMRGGDLSLKRRHSRRRGRPRLSCFTGMIFHRRDFRQSRCGRRPNVSSFASTTCYIPSRMHWHSVCIDIDRLSTLRRRRSAKFSRTYLFVLNFQPFVANLRLCEAGREK